MICRFRLSLAFLAAACVWATSHAEPTLHWYRGNTHTHTSAPPRSDANETPGFVAQWYRDHGYQFVVITDHEFLTDVAPVNRKLAKNGEFLVLPGQEITQMVADASHPGGVRHAHVNAIDAKRVIYPVGPEHTSMAAVYARNASEVRTAGGLLQINHPNRAWSAKASDLMSLPSPFVLEIWNPASSSNNLGGADEAGHAAPSVEGMWDELLSQGMIVWASAADDAHTYHQFDLPESPNPGRAWIVVRAPELTKAAVLSAIRAGDFYASTGIELERWDVTKDSIEIRMRPLGQWSASLRPTTRYHTRFVGQSGRTLAEVNGASARYVFRGDEKYVRAAIIDSDGRRAWTQPVFFDGRLGKDRSP